MESEGFTLSFLCTDGKFTLSDVISSEKITNFAVNKKIDQMIRFDNDYMAGCHPKILEQLSLTNLEETPGYGHDHYCKEASELLKCGL